MKKTLLAVAVLAGLTTTTASAQAVTSMHGMPMKGAVKAGRGSGVVTAIDPIAAKVTIQHGPFAALSVWSRHLVNRIDDETVEPHALPSVSFFEAHSQPPKMAL
jgi:Cu/Ag efflux protein CusF